jgi:hypothetical protein
MDAEFAGGCQERIVDALGFDDDEPTGPVVALNPIGKK